MTHIKMAAICHDTSTYLKDTFMLQFLLLMHVWTSNINIYKTYLRGLGDYICSHKFLKMHTAIQKHLYSNSEMCKWEDLLSCPRWLLPLLKGLVPTDLLQLIFHSKTFTSVRHAYTQGRRNGIGLLNLWCHKPGIQVKYKLSLCTYQCYTLCS
jgi:hypothetical protein